MSCADPKVEIWDDLGWLIANGEVAPEEASTVLDAALASLAAADSSADITETDAVPPRPKTVTCALRNARSSTGCDQGRVSFGVRIDRSSETVLGRKQGEKSTGTTARSSKAVDDHEVQRDLPKQQEGTAAISQEGTGKIVLANNSETAFTGIDELLDFSPGSSGSGSGRGLVMSSTSSLGTTVRSTDSGGITSALGPHLLGNHASAVEAPLDDSWSSAEEQKVAGLGGDRREMESSVVALPPTPEASAAKLAARAEPIGQAEDPTRPEGVLSTPAHRKEEARPLVDPPAGASMGTDKESGEGFSTAGVLSATHSSSSPGNLANVAAASPAYSSRNEGYSDEDFEDEGDGEDREEGAEPDTQSLFSFSSASSASSLGTESNGDDDEDGGKADREESRGTRRYMRDEMMVSEAAVLLRQRLRRAAEKYGEDEREGVTILFNRLDEVRE